MNFNWEAQHPGQRTDATCLVLSPAEKLLEDVRHAMARDPDAARAAALRLVALLTPAAVDPAHARGGLAPWQKRKIDRYLRENLEHPLPVERLAELVALSVSHFCRAFKESFGTTPHMHIIRLRLALAQQLMVTTTEPLSQIGLACGMADQAHFSTLFRRVVGETPSAWRKRNLTDAQAEMRSRARLTTAAGGNPRQSWKSAATAVALEQYRHDLRPHADKIAFQNKELERDWPGCRLNASQSRARVVARGEPSAATIPPRRATDGDDHNARGHQS